MTSVPAPPLSAAETAALAWADREERTHLTTRIIAGLLGGERGREVAVSLARKGLPERLSQGVYRVLPMGAAGTKRTAQAEELAPELIEKDSYLTRIAWAPQTPSAMGSCGGAMFAVQRTCPLDRTCDQANVPVSTPPS